MTDEYCSDYKRVTFGEFLVTISFLSFALTPLLAGVPFMEWASQLWHLLAVFNNSPVMWFGVIVMGIHNVTEMIKRIKARKRREKKWTEDTCLY